MEVKLTLMGKVIVVLLALAALGMYAVGWENTLPQLAVAVIVCIGLDALAHRLKYNHYGLKPSQEATITGLIIGMVLAPGASALVVAVACVAAVAAKVLIAERHRNIFNPAAFGLMAAAAVMHPYLGWWGSMGANVFILGIPVLVVALGAYVTWQAHRFDAVLTFIAAFLALVSIYTFANSGQVEPLAFGMNWFFAFIMVSEPITCPLTKKGRYIYGTLIGVVAFASTFLIPLYAEVGALVLANALVPAMNRYIK